VPFRQCRSSVAVVNRPISSSRTRGARTTTSPDVHRRAPPGSTAEPVALRSRPYDTVGADYRIAASSPHQHLGMGGTTESNGAEGRPDSLPGAALVRFPPPVCLPVLRPAECVAAAALTIPRLKPAISPRTTNMALLLMWISSCRADRNGISRYHHFAEQESREGPWIRDN
jgi:hypothetical protein